MCWTVLRCAAWLLVAGLSAGVVTFNTTEAVSDIDALGCARVRVGPKDLPSEPCLQTHTRSSYRVKSKEIRAAGLRPMHASDLRTDLEHNVHTKKRTEIHAFDDVTNADIPVCVSSLLESTSSSQIPFSVVMQAHLYESFNLRHCKCRSEFAVLHKHEPPGIERANQAGKHLTPCFGRETHCTQVYNIPQEKYAYA